MASTGDPTSDATKLLVRLRFMMLHYCVPILSYFQRLFYQFGVYLSFMRTLFLFSTQFRIAVETEAADERTLSVSFRFALLSTLRTLHYPILSTLTIFFSRTNTHNRV